MNAIVVTTPTGTIGRQVLENVLAGGATVRVIVRDPSRLPPATLARVEVVEGSHGDLAVVRQAFRGAEAVFWLPPPNPRAARVEDGYAEFTRPACEAFRTEGVKRVVGISALGRGYAGPAGQVTASLAMDDLIAASGVSYRALTMPSFMDNVLRQVVPIRTQGVFSWPGPGDLKAPTCATCDIAAVAARLLLDPSWSGVGSVPVLGPEDLSPDEMVAIMAEVLGKPVRFQRIPDDAFKASMLAMGVSEAMAQARMEMMAAKAAGLDTMVPRTPEGTTPTSFRRWCEEVLKPAVLA